MLEDLLTTSLPSVSSMIGDGYVPPEAVSISSFFSGFGALILGKFTGSVGMITMPMNYVALFAGALIANYSFQGVRLPIDQAVQQPLLVTLSGMAIAAFAMMYWLQDRAHSR